MIFSDNSLDSFNTFSDKKIICFGTHSYLQELFDYLNLYDRIECFCVLPPYGKKREISIGKENYKIEPITSLNLYSPETHIILITDDNISSVIRYLNNQPLIDQNYHIFHKFFYSLNDRFFNRFMKNTDCYSYFSIAVNKATIKPEDFGLKDKKTLGTYIRGELQDQNKNIIPIILFDITTKCTLNCKDCLALTPHYDNNEKCNVPYETVIKDIETFLNAVDYVIDFELIGGETFLHPDLDKIIEYLLSVEKIGMISIMTNVTVLPTDKVFNLLKHPKIVLGISVYKETEYTKSIMYKMIENHIKMECRSFIGAKDWIPNSSDVIMRWAPMRDIKLRDISHEQAKNEYLLCGARVCRSILDGKLYACQVSERMHNICLLNNKNDYISLYETNDLRNDIKKIYEQMGCGACYHCHMADLNCKSIPGGEQESKNC